MKNRNVNISQSHNDSDSEIILQGKVMRNEKQILLALACGSG